MDTNVTRLKWFHFSQNNSGGYFVRDENVCEEVYIQAASAAEAVAKAETIMSNEDSCPCCGDRWWLYVDDSDGTDSPEIYGRSIYSEEPSYFREEARLHFYDGTVETYRFGEEPQKRVA